MKSAYRTIKEPSEGLFKDRGSKFIACAFPVRSEEEVKEILDSLRKEYHDARHHCYAWRLGPDPVSARANDDGEPSNSAGKPILNQIEKAGLINVLVVVIRYFGGTLLGVGGLINAYRTAAESAILNSRIIRKKIQHHYALSFDYARMNDVMTVIKEHRLETYEQVFEVSCAMNFKVDLNKEETVLSKLKLIEGCTFNMLADE
jgi:uncharacterized YigZ family protein